MNRSNFFTLKAIISVAFALALILIPSLIMSIFGIDLTETGEFIARLFGVEMLAVGFVCWYSRSSTDKLVTDIMLGLFAADAIGSVIMVAGQINGIMNPLGWLNVVLWLFFTLGLGYFRFIQPNTN